MLNINNWLKQHFKAVIAYTIGIIAGVLLACLNNGIRQDLTYQAAVQPVNNNWVIISIIFLVMIAMIVTGFIMGKVYEKKENDIF